MNIALQENDRTLARNYEATTTRSESGKGETATPLDGMGGHTAAILGGGSAMWGRMVLPRNAN